MARAFVLIDAVPGGEDGVFESLSKIPGVVGKRMLNPKVGSADLICLVEGEDHDAVEKLITGRLRGLAGVFSVQRMMPQHTVMGPLPRIMMEMEQQAGARKE